MPFANVEGAAPDPARPRPFFPRIDLPMSWMQRLIERVTAGPEPARSLGPSLDEERERTQQTILRTLSFGLQVREAELEIIEHSALVSILCGSLARLLALPESEAYTLQTAAQLHEVAMFAVPAELLLKETPLTAEELETVRRQAKASAELAAIMHPPRVARLIEHQYDDYASLADRMSEGDLLLAGILRVADVVAAVTRPRPYQDPLPIVDRAMLLQSGAGTRFHPQAVQCALQLSQGGESPG